MTWFFNLSIRTKLVIGFGVMWLFIAVVSVVAYRGLESIRLSEQGLNDHNFRIAQDLMTTRNNDNFNHAKIMEMMLTPNKADHVKMEAEMRERDQQTDALIEGLVKIDLEPDCLARYRQVKDLLTAYRETREKQIALIHAGKVDQARDLSLGSQVEIIGKLRTLAQAHGDEAFAKIDQQLAADMQEARSSELLFVACALAALLFGVFMTVLMNKALAQPLSAVSSIASRIASRDDLSVEFPVSERRDEVGTLTQAFRTMIQNIRAATTDIAEAKRLETELRASSFYARNLIEASLDPLVTISPEGKITDVNKTTEQVTGVARERLIGSDFSEYFTEPEKAREGYQKVFAEGVVRDYPLTIRHAAGRTTDVLYNASVYKNEVGQVQGVFAAARDITERKRMDEELRVASLYARNLIEASLDPLVTISAEGKITDVNKTTEQVTGAVRERLIGSDFSDYFTEPVKAREGYQKVFAEGAVRDYPLTIRHAAGRTTDVLYNASVYKNEAGQVQGVFAAARDVTERKKMDEELRGYREQLEEMVKKRTAELADVLSEVKSTVNVLAGSSAEILSSTTQVATSTAETATAISETTTTVEEVRQAAQLSAQKAKNVAGSAQQVSQVGQAGQKAVDEVVAGMEHIRTQMESIATTIVRLSEQTQSIGGIIAAVTDIADQSNLLAVNAAIEATRAGEQGKAFGVVAQEIKSLAEQSKQATLQVRGILSDVQRATSAAVMATEQGSKSVEAGVRQSAQAGEAIMRLAESSQDAVQTATQIVASSQQQVVGMDQIGLAMENINKAGAQTAVSTTQVETAARNLHEMGQKLKGLVEQFKG